VVSLQEEYKEKVIRQTLEECRAGRTPNPDILCNSLIKFGVFYEKFGALFDRVATGHYARYALSSVLQFLGLVLMNVQHFLAGSESRTPATAMRTMCSS
jgi:tRNA U34 2-thiouridine synthase MnmA/TrmU